MAPRSLGVSEARRLLPRLVRTIAAEGGRVDVTLRGRPQVSIVRTADVLDRSVTVAHGRRERLPSALDVEFLVPAEQLVGVVRKLRAHVGAPRPTTPRAARVRKRQRRR